MRMPLQTGWCAICIFRLFTAFLGLVASLVAENDVQFCFGVTPLFPHFLPSFGAEKCQRAWTPQLSVTPPLVHRRVFIVLHFRRVDRGPSAHTALGSPPPPAPCVLAEEGCPWSAEVLGVHMAMVEGWVGDGWTGNHRVRNPATLLEAPAGPLPVSCFRGPHRGPQDTARVANQRRVTLIVDLHTG